MKEKDTLGIKHPHDHFIKKILSSKENIISFFQNYLPEDLTKLICLESIEGIKDTFIDAKLRNSQSDLLFQLNIKDQPVYLYLLFEHKSEPEVMTPLQLLKYKVRIWEKEKKNHPGLKKLTPVIGYVFYHGTREWKLGTSFQELYGSMDESLKKYLLNFEYILRNIRLLQDEEISGNPEIQTTVYIMKHIFDEDLIEALRKLLDRQETIFTNKDFEQFMFSFFVYLYSVRSIKPEEIQELIKEKEMIDPVTLEKTTAEVLIEQGIQQGMWKEKQYILTQQLNRKFHLKESEKILINKINDLKKLDQALERILFAENKDEILNLLR